MEYSIDEKYSLSIFHFNLQYVAGNLKTYHHLHKSSMRPFLKFYNENPQWKASLEGQGHYFKFIQKFYPEDLKLLKKLNDKGQIELVSVHYSDQIYLAYPKRDMDESLKINKEIFNELAIERSGVWFGQENFFGQGIAERIMENHGFHTALVNRHLLWHADNEIEKIKAPYWRFNGVESDNINYLMSTGQHYENKEEGIRINQRFSYWDDAELAFGATPYAPWLAKPEQQYNDQLRKYMLLQKDGIKVVKVKDYIDRVKELKLKPKEGPFIVDGTWNTRYYGGVYLWMGTYRLPWERDAKLRSLTYRVRERLLIVEKMIDWVKKESKTINKKTLDHLIRMAWKHLLLAEVSDSTGQTPFLVEIYYTDAECKACIDYIERIEQMVVDILNISQEKLSSKFKNTKNNHNKLGQQVQIKDIKHLFPPNKDISMLRSKRVDFKIHKVDDKYAKDNRHFILDVNFSTKYTPFIKRIMIFFRDGRKKPGFAKLFDKSLGNYAGIDFPMWEKKIIYSPACMEDTMINKEIGEFDFKRTWLPLPNGLIGLGNDAYIIKHNYYKKTHIAATLNCEQEDSPRVCFHVLNPPWFIRFKWRYSIFKGSKDEALEIANSLNVFPIIKN